MKKVRQFNFGEGLVVNVQPGTEPLTVSEVKNWIKVDHSADDTLIESLIKAARLSAENYTGIKLFTQTIVETWDSAPIADHTYNQFSGISLSTWPVQSISSVQYSDEDGVNQTWSSGNYMVDLNSYPCRISPNFDTSWPTLQFTMKAITVTYIAGYSSVDNIPDDIKTAMYLMITSWYDNRTDSIKKMPTASESLLNPYKLHVHV
jgi:uncharacterized phiE125 gp8 family phage protein